MFHDIPAQSATQTDAPAFAPHPLALALIQALSGCCHPRASRLTERLLVCECPDQLSQLKGDVLHLLALSFGPQEARRRLHPLQLQ